MQNDNLTVEEARNDLLRLSFSGEATSIQIGDAMGRFEDAVRRQERERTKEALNILNNYQLWPETRISQARAILARSSEETGG